MKKALMPSCLAAVIMCLAAPLDLLKRRAAAFFTAWNSGQEAMIAKFYAEHRLPSPKGLSPAESAKIWRGVLFELEEAKPHKVKSMKMWDAAAPAAQM
ncbi:MAG: hypothetical protein JOZ52_15055 [Acidobacteria bacterium]|nr:hypothetical protein [Acidobacteriota bacterium]